MPKVLFKFQLEKRILLTFLMLLFLNNIYSQHKIVIPFGDKIELGKVSDDTRFEIQGPESARVKGNKINEYQFEIPGNYTIRVVGKKHQEADCTRQQLPKEILVEVSRVRMAFSQPITVSAPIVKNANTQGITLRVPVQVQTYDHLPATINSNPVASAGIGSNIMAHLITPAKELPEGLNQLEYSLSGTATQNAYLMFDFIDANNQVQSIPFLTPVKN